MNPKVRRYAAIVLVGIGISLFLLAWNKSAPLKFCQSDFGAFYAGGTLAFTPQLYSTEPGDIERRREILGCHGGPFIRLPVFAALFWPLAKLPVALALNVWRALCAAAVLAFIWLWPGPRWLTLCVCVWSFPLLSAFLLGQDVPILLCISGLSFLLLARGQDTKAGMLLSAGLAKPHLFAILVVLIFVRRFWRAAIGLCAGGTLLLVASFMTAGLSWPLVFVGHVTDRGSNPHPETMVNLHGLATYFHAPGWAEGVLAVVLLALIWRACLNMAAPDCLALALAAGVLLGMHSYLYDLVLCIPLILVVLNGRDYPDWLKIIAVIFASPISYLVPSTLPIAAFTLLLFLILTSVAAVPISGPIAPSRVRQEVGGHAV